MTPTVDTELQAHIPPLSPAEQAQLEASLLAEGCRDPLVVWRGLLLDGHHRLTICKRHGLPFRTVEADLPDRAAALDWIDRNQIGRRNLSLLMAAVVRGRIYNRARRQGARTDITSGRSCPKSTADRLIAEWGCSPRTVKADGALAIAVEALVADFPGVVAAVATGRWGADGPRLSRQALGAAAVALDASPSAALDELVAAALDRGGREAGAAVCSELALACSEAQNRTAEDRLRAEREIGCLLREAPPWMRAALKALPVARWQVYLDDFMDATERRLNRTDWL